MAGGQPLDLQSKVGRLSNGQVQHLCNFLLLNENWRNVAGHLSRPDGSPRFSFMEIEVIKITSRNPANSLFTTLMTDGYTIGRFISVLTELQLYAIADYLAVNVLGGAPVGQGAGGQGFSQHVPQSPIDNRQPFPQGLTTPQQKQQPHRPPPQPHQHQEVLYQNMPNGGASAVYNQPPSYASYGQRSYHLDHHSGLPTPNLYQTPTEFPSRSNTSIDGGNFQYSMLAKLTNQFDDCPKIEGGHLIGVGGSSSVFYAKEDGGREIAIKRFQCNRSHSSEQYENELKLLPRLVHEGILPLLGSAFSPEFKCLIYPYMSNGSLLDRLACKDRSKPLTLHERIRIILAVAQALKFLREKGFVHRDMKSSNVLLDGEMNPRIADFGISRQSINMVDEPATTTMVVMGTLGYMAPEATNNVISAKLDVFSYGVILLEILTASKPYDPKRTDEEALHQHVPDTVEELIKFDFLDKRAGTWEQGTVRSIFDLAGRCLRRKPDSRPSMQEIVEVLQESDV